MAKKMYVPEEPEAQSMSLFDEIQAAQQKLDQLRSKAEDDLHDRLNAVLEDYDRLEVALPQSLVARVEEQLWPHGRPHATATVPKPAKAAATDGEKKERKARSCKLCARLGFTDHASGHIEKGHDKWLALQTDTVKAKFQRALVDGGEPRLVQPEPTEATE